MRRSLALTFLLAGCVQSSVDFGLILPRGAEEQLAAVDEAGCYRLTARRGTEAFEATARSPWTLSLHGLPTGTYDVEIEAVEQPTDRDTCEGGELRARARTFGASLRADRPEQVPLLLVPVDRPVTLDVPAWVEAWLEERTDLAAVVAKDAAAVPRVVLAGGRTPDGPGAEVLVYEPREARFTALPDLVCARAGAAALAVGEPDGDEKVLLIGGVGDCAASAPEGSTASSTSELLDLSSGETQIAKLQAPVERTMAVRDGAGAWVIGSTTTDPIVQRFGRDGWQPIPASDERIPVRGGVFTSIFPDGSAPFLVAGGRTGGPDGGELLRTVSLFEPGEFALSACAIDVPTAPVAGDHVVAAPIDSGDVLFAASALDGTLGAPAPGSLWFRQTFREDCRAVRGIEQGALGRPRTDPVVTPVRQKWRSASGAPAEASVMLLSGGDAEGTVEVLNPGVPGTLLLAGDAAPRHGHVALALEDGSVLIAGGGPGDVLVVLPREGAGSRLRWDLTAEPSPELDVIVVASNHAEAADVRDLLIVGGYFDEQTGFQSRTGPPGLTAAIPPLDDEFGGGDRVTVVITSADMRCEDRVEEGDGGLPRACTLEPSPDLSDEERVRCTLEELEDEHACAAQELLRAATRATQSPAFEGHADVPLLVLIAAPRDDCSGDETGRVFEPGERPLTERCADAGDLLDPAEVAATLSGLRGDALHGESALVSVMTFGGPDEPFTGEPVAEACPGVRPTPRLAALARAMGERGRHVDLCHTDEGHPPLQWFSELVINHIFRRVCVSHAVAAPASCVVAYERERADDVREAVRIPAGDDGWRILPGDPDGCQVLEISPDLVLPIGAKVGYACQ